MKRRGIARTTAMAMAAAMILTACGGGNTDQSTNAPAGGSAQTTTDNGGSGEITKTDIVVAMGADVVTLDPAGQQDTTSGVLIHHVYSTLMDIDDDGNLVPDLAESYEMKSDTEYTFKLRDDACFSDGTPVTAKAVKFTYDRATDMPKTKSNTSKIAEVIADDDYQIKAAVGDYCFVEDKGYALEGVSEIILCHWNRKYQADKVFDIDLKANGFKKVDSEDIKGSSHDKITIETYRKG